MNWYDNIVRFIKTYDFIISLGLKPNDEFYIKYGANECGTQFTNHRWMPLSFKVPSMALNELIAVLESDEVLRKYELKYFHKSDENGMDIYECAVKM